MKDFLLISKVIAITNDITFLGDFSGEKRYLPVQVHAENISLLVMYDPEEFPVLESISREEHQRIVKKDFEGAIAEAVCLYENDLHDFYFPKELRSDLDYVIQTHKSENGQVQNFLDFMEQKETRSDIPDLLCFTEFTGKYPETNEKVFLELMANEMRNEWVLEPSVKSKKYKIDGMIRVSKKFYVRKSSGDSAMETLLRWITFCYHFKNFQKFTTPYFATDFKGSEIGGVISFNFDDYY